MSFVWSRCLVLLARIQSAVSLGSLCKFMSKGCLKSDRDSDSVEALAFVHLWVIQFPEHEAGSQYCLQGVYQTISRSVLIAFLSFFRVGAGFHCLKLKERFVIIAMGRKVALWGRPPLSTSPFAPPITSPPPPPVIGFKQVSVMQIIMVLLIHDDNLFYNPPPPIYPLPLQLRSHWNEINLGKVRWPGKMT